ncbi:zinc finger 501-like, putative [Babesia ovis]|uniref:Zinc finger 501-like, putative n=1 Tax=Babesia ovis TaxID=5869 RepID=A0A9W5T9G5_BABOV|nr:zinc finger 501-like, putative [Babesia ovis]
MKDDIETKLSHSAAAEDVGADDIGASSDDEVDMDQLVSSIMKGMSKAFNTATSNKDRGATDAAPQDPPKLQKRVTGVSIRALPDEASEIEERRYMKIANNGVIRLFELLNQS